MATFREVGPTDHDSWREVVSWVYTQGPPPEAPRPLASGELRFIVESEGKAVSACRVFDFGVTRGTANVRCGGVAAVATLVEHRDSNYASELMRGALGAMRDRGFAVSALYPFRAPFYRRFGYENCGYRLEVTCPAHRLPMIHDHPKVARLEASDWRTLDQIYTAFGRQRAGLRVRSEDDWATRLGTEPKGIYVVGDPPAAYAWAAQDPQWGKVTVTECAWIDAAGHEGLMSLFRSLTVNQTSIVWHEPPDGESLWRGLDQGVEVRLAMPTMFRIVDVAAALTALRPATTGSVAIRVDDDACDWNNGTWQVKWSPEGVRVSPAEGADVFLDVRHLALAVMGQPSLVELARQGVVGGDDQAIEALAGLLTPAAVVMLDAF